MDKLGRAYSLQVEKQDGTTLTVELPFTIEFDINRNVLSSANEATIRIYNLSENNRKQLRFDLNNFDVSKRIQLKAGYVQNLSLIFDGNVQRGWSVREGSDFITTLSCFDAGFGLVNSTTAINIPANTPQGTALKNIIGNLQDVSLGAVGDYPGTNSRGSSYTGATSNILNELTAGGFFVDNGKAYCLNNDEFIGENIPTINSASGLLSTPYLENYHLIFDIIFEPTLHVGQAINLDSITAANFNGLCKLVGLKHRGTISAAVCGEAITSIELFYGVGLKKVS